MEIIFFYIVGVILSILVYYYWYDFNPEPSEAFDWGLVSLFPPMWLISFILFLIKTIEIIKGRFIFK